VPAAWSLDRTARSHGWCGLPPNAYDPVRGLFHRTLELPDAGPLTVSVGPDGTVTWGRVPGTAADRAAIRTQLATMFAFDVDLTGFHRACERFAPLGWAPGVDAGRLLRSPTVWEDLARTLATTNCSWSLTRSMVTRLVDTLGREGPAGERAFPSPDSVVAAGEPHLRDVVRAGYRSAAFVALAQRIPELGSLSDTTRSDEETLATLLALRGFGPYAAQGMLGLLGRPRGVALDAWVRARLPAVVGREAMTDKQITERYAPLGRWAGTGLWLELTRDWFD
jgi:N-glycosylase/DNA lyase